MAMTERLLKFIDKCKSPFHTIDNAKSLLISNGYQELFENIKFDIVGGGKYFVTRNDSAMIAFEIPQGGINGFHMVASHGDSPSFKLKENAEMMVEGSYVKLNVEGYGGMIMSTWFDRPLSVAGRIFIDTKNGIQSKLVDIDEDLMVIPNLAIHMNRDANNGMKYNAQIDLCPLVAITHDIKEFPEYLAQGFGVNKEDILGRDLYLYTREEGKVIGMNKDMILAPRIDDLTCVYTSLEALIDSKTNSFVNVAIIMDNEEVGSATRQGADSDFLMNTLKRIVYAMDGDDETYMRLIADSFMISADNAHALHPNYGVKQDPTNRPKLNGGVVIKFAGNQKYTTDGYSGSFIKKICKEAGVPHQIYFNRSDMAGGSTLGNISVSQVSVRSADIGMAQLSMHSAVEMAGAKDVEYMYKALKGFYNM